MTRTALIGVPRWLAEETLQELRMIPDSLTTEWIDKAMVLHLITWWELTLAHGAGATDYPDAD